MRFSESWLRKTVRTLTIVAFAAVLAACGGAGTGYDSGGGSNGGGSDGDMSVSVTKPADGATVTAPFTVKIDSSEPLGTTDTGKHHVHVWFDDNADDYMVVESATTKITELADGSHTMHVSLRNADHSPAGAETDVSITVGDSPGGSTSGGDTGDDPYGY